MKETGFGEQEQKPNYIIGVQHVLPPMIPRIGDSNTLQLTMSA
jgi:hypothetical protein